MGNNIKKDIVTIRKVNEINKQISIQIVSSKLTSNCNDKEYFNSYEGKVEILIFVGVKPIIFIPGKIFMSFEQAIHEISIFLEKDEDPYNSNLPDILFQKLVLILQSWIANGYNTQSLPYRMAFPLLKELREIEETKFQIIFQQEILRRYATGSKHVKKFLTDEGYLMLIGGFF